MRHQEFKGERIENIKKLAWKAKTEVIQNAFQRNEKYLYEM